MADLAKINGTSIEDLAKLWGKDVADIAKVMGLDVPSGGGDTVTAGTPVVFESSKSEYITVTTMDSTHAIVCYKDGGNSDYGTAVALTLSGTTITAGTPVVFESAAIGYTIVTTMDSTHAIVCYMDGGNSSYGTSNCLTLS